MAAKEIRRAKLRERMLGDRAFYAEMISVVVPIIIQNTVSNVVSLLDNVMVGRVGTLQMSAVAIVNQLLFVFNLCIFGGLAGAGIFATQYAGAHDHKGVRDCFRVKWMISLSMLACALAVFIALPKQLIGMYLAEETAQADAAATLGFGMDYLTVMLWGLLPFGVTQVYASTLREVGETRLPMLASVAAILVNLVFNYFLIFGKCGFPEMGVTGAAIATVISQIVSCVVGFWYMRRRYELLRFSVRELRLDRTAAGRVLKIGAPMAIQQSIVSCGFLFLQKLVNLFGESMIASYTVATRMENILMIPIVGIQNTMATFAGQNMGAQRPDRVSKGLGQGVLVSLGMTMILCLAQIAGIPLIIRAFQLDAGAAAICRLHLFSSAVAIPIFAVYFPANGMCQGVGEGFHATFYALLALGLRVVFAYALHKTSLFGYTAIWWSQAMSWTITLVVCYVHFFRGKWKDKSLIS